MRCIEIQKEQLGTPIVLTIVTEDEAGARLAAKLAFEEAERIEKTYSRFLEGNELATLNEQVGEWVTVSEELFNLIAFGVRLGERTRGAFDLTVKSILEGWGYDSSYSLKEGTPGRTGRVELGENFSVRALATLELGGLGKGYVLDRMFSFFTEFPNVSINAGGDLIVKGSDLDSAEGNTTRLRRGWRIVLEHPTDATQGIGYVDTMGLAGLALAASSPSRRAWRDRHHLVDPRKGEPAMDMLAVYTQSSSALLADSYATALFVLGFEEAKSVLAGEGGTGGLRPLVEALLVSPEGRAYRSEGFQGVLFEA